MPEVILVNGEDEVLGAMEKMEAHEKGILHRAFSIFIFNSKGEMLLQQRATGKYHSGGLWTNTCCSHPLPGEQTPDAAHRRLMEEMGFDTLLQPVFHFTYEALLENGLTEHEYDHVFTGTFDGPVSPDEAEVKAHRYLSMDALRKDIELHPHLYTAWFKIAFPKLESYLANSKD